MAGGEVVEGAVGDGAAAIDDDRVLAQVLDEVELVRREQHRRAAARLAHEHLGQGVDGDRVESGERLVEHEHVGLVDEGADQLHALLVAEREVLEVAPRPVAEVEALQPANRPFARRRLAQSAQPAEVDELVADAHGRVQPALLGQVAEAAANRVVDGAPSHRTSPASRAVSPKMARIVVVLPAPLGPRKPVTIPGGR